MSAFKIGDKVALKAAFLRSISDFSFEAASKRGTVIEIIPIAKGVDLIGLAGWGGSGRVLSTNLILADRIHLES